MYLPTTHQHMTADKFAVLPEGLPYFQLVEGEPFFMATLSRLHQDIVGNLHFAIKAHLRANPAVGRVYPAPFDVRLDDSNVFEPDIYFVAQEQSHILTDEGVIRRAVPDCRGALTLYGTARPREKAEDIFSLRRTRALACSAR